MADTNTTEADRRARLAESRSPARTAGADGEAPSQSGETAGAAEPAYSAGGEEREGGTSTERVVLAEWAFVFAAAGIVWLLGLLLDLLIPAVTFLVNYLAVLALWMWAKAKRLRPPTFATAARGVTGKAGGTGAIAGAVPGSDVLYILAGGITPLIYLAALWWNNR